MIDWKKVAKHYRSMSHHALLELLRSREVGVYQGIVVQAAQEFVEAVQSPVNPFVSLVTGEDLNVQNYKDKLIEAVLEYERYYEQVMQTYRQTDGENDSPSEP
jgi:hypothetical protein